MTEDQKRKMREGRERARKAGKTRAKRTPKALPAYTFNIDEGGALAIVDQKGAGIELDLAASRRLCAFLMRALPRDEPETTA